MNIHLNGLKMNAVETDPNGAISRETIFEFNQDGPNVSASYGGGEILQGFLVGVIKEASLDFRYCQLHVNGELNGGHSACELRRSPEGLVQIIEHFQWESKREAGRNVIQELPEVV